MECYSEEHFNRELRMRGVLHTHTFVCSEQIPVAIYITIFTVFATVFSSNNGARWTLHRDTSIQCKNKLVSTIKSGQLSL